VTLLPPVPRPPKVICVARNYAAHAAEAKKELLEFPNLFVRFANTLVADGDAVQRPVVSDELDWEGELAFVVGKGGRHIREEDAYDHVFGYSIFNDVTVRDYQFRVPQFVAGKNFETSGPFGPALVTRDEISDPHDLELEVKVNDDVVQSVNTGDMLFKIPFLVSHLSEFISLEPGDVVATGTPAGVGFTRTPPRFLVPGDVMRVSISGLGVLTNPVEQEPKP
jgi:acylpyruvate hydrolase